ncbi:MAG TPA: aminotransferase class I/II-fold pyridoxal phosphate-dependent enzyme [Bryobacteraceae bacterium]|nr:aminotransferase class I/II-fold pyridoxal phosphate-dependent enzyme [Bryobacteraceae bacterium]
MLTAISRYGARVLPDTQQLIADCVGWGELVEGPAIEEFEEAFSQRHENRSAVAASYGRMAFYYILKALNLPAGSEVIFPALTFWVVPEIARVLGLRPVFVDVDRKTFNMNPSAVDRAVTAKTRAIVPTHLYGLPCDMDEILDIATKHNLAVIEDCAHSLGALYRGRPVGTFGEAAFFSFQTLKPLNTYGGGMAVVRDASLASAVRGLAHSEPLPTEAEVRKKLNIGRVQRILTRPSVFRWTLFPILWAASFVRARPDVYLWEAIRPLDPLPPDYRRRYSNVQAVIGLEALRHLAGWTAATRRNAELLAQTMTGVPGVQLPVCPADRTHVFYQYALRVGDRDRVVRSCIRRGLDIETLHVDVCTRLPMFQPFWSPAPEADYAAEAVQLPVYASLSENQVRWVSRIVRGAVSGNSPAPTTVPQSARD